MPRPAHLAGLRQVRLLPTLEESISRRPRRRRFRPPRSISSAAVDGLPPNPPPLPVAATNRFQLLDAYVGMNVANWQFSYGRRSLWWGPSEGGTMLFTNNAAPLNNMFSIDRVSPFRLPWIFRYLGDMRLQAFIGQLSGQEFLTTSFSRHHSWRNDRTVRAGLASATVSERRKDQLQVHPKLRVRHVEDDDLRRTRKSTDA